VQTTNSQSMLAAACDARHADPATSATEARCTALFIVASPRRQTGKTFLARLVADFLRMDGGPVEAFDLVPDLVASEDALADFLPAITSTASLESTPSQMALFDRLILADGVPRVVDVGHAVFTRFFALMEEIDFGNEARRRTLETIILFAADAHPTSAKAYAILQRRLSATLLVPVFNDAIVKARRVRDQYPFSRVATVPLQIPLLPPGLKAYADRSGLSFSDIHVQRPIALPSGPALELQSWTRRAFLEFREFELRLLMEKLRESLGQ
jgi:hypothetical protein